MNHKIYSWYLMDQHLLFLKESAKVMKHQQDSWVISETRSLMINTSKCEGRSQDYWGYFLNRHLKLITLTNSGAVF